MIQAIKSEIKIRNLNDVEPVKQSLRYVFNLIGLKADQIPLDFERDILLKFIFDNYGGLDPNEIRIAFELAIKGEFQVETNHFGNFSSMYFAKVVNAYQEFRTKAVLQVQREAEKMKLEEEALRDPTKEELENIQNEFELTVVLPIFESYKQIKVLSFGLTPVKIVFKTVFSRAEELSSVERKLIKVEAEERVKSLENKLSTKKASSFEEHKLLKDLLNSLTIPERRSDQILEECYKIAIEKAFDSWIESGFDYQSEILKSKK